MSWRTSWRGRSLGVALDDRQVVAVVPPLARGGEPRVWVRPLAPADLETGSWPELASALAELREIAGAARSKLAVAVAGSDVQERCVSFEAMPDREVRRVLHRDAGRLFPADANATVLASQARPRGAREPVFAAAAPAALVDAVFAAAEQANWRIDRLIPAHAAWIAAALASDPPATTGRTAVVVERDVRTDVLVLENGRAVRVRRVARSAANGEAVSRTLHEEGDPRVVVLRGAAGSREAMVAAARFAAVASAPELVSDVVRARRSAARRRVLLHASWVAAAVVAVLAAGLLWSTTRDLSSTRARRTVLHGRVAALLATQDTLVHVASAASELARFERNSPHWSELVVLLARALPQDAYLVSLRAEGDSAALDGIAGNAEEAIAALRRAPGVLAVRADAPIRQELGAGGVLVERFALTLQLAPAAPGTGQVGGGSP